MAIEVVSEDEEDRLRDLETKRQEHPAAGISEYWIVDPREHRILVLTLENAAYIVVRHFAAIPRRFWTER